MNRARGSTFRPHRRVVASLAALALALMLTATAGAGRGDPQRKITPADQARAKAMNLRYSDFKVFVSATVDPAPPPATSPCDDESDLTVTGDARSKRFSPLMGGNFVWSFSKVFVSRADLRKAWRRVTTKSFAACEVALASRELRKAGMRFISFGELPFPELAPKTIAYRLRYADKDGPAPVDYLILGNSRGAVQIVFDWWDKEDEITLGRIVAKRMAKVMAGA